MSTSSVIVKLAIFAAGVAAGWLLALNAQKTSPVPSPAMPTSGADVTVTPATRQIAKSVWLTVEFDGGSTLVPAARLAESGTLIASLFSVYPANSVYYLNADGEQVFPPVIASDPITNLIAFKDEQSKGYDVSEEDGSLFIGKRITLTLPDSTIEGQIESPLQTALNGRHYFDVAFARSGSRRGGPLLDETSEKLIGFVTTMRGTPPSWMYLSGKPYSAVDATSIRSLLRDSTQAPQNVRDFSVQFARTPGGLRYSIPRLAAREQWGEVLAALEALALIDINNSDMTQQAITLAAYYRGHQLVDDSEAGRALTLAADMKQRFPQQQPWCLVESRAYGTLQRWRQAYETARVCLNDPYGTRPRDREELSSPSTREALSQIDTRPEVLARAHNAAIRFGETDASRAERLDTLLGALNLGEHPQVYRLLGDLEYEAQNYSAAQNYYRSAIRLDPSISASLGNRLRNSTQRADSGPATEIEFEQYGGGIVVSARLNDSPQSFRLLVDTGATYSALSGGTLLRLGLGGVLNGVSQVVELEAAGGTIYAQRFTLDSMQIGSARVSQVPVVILENMEGFDGLVGLSFLRHFDVSLDQQAGKLILMRR